MHKYSGVVAILESDFYDFSKTELHFHNPMLVKDKFRNKIGQANVFVNQNKIMAELEIELELPTSTFISASGLMGFEDAPQSMIDFFGKKRKVKSASIYALYVTDKKPKDFNILPLEQIE